MGVYGNVRVFPRILPIRKDRGMRIIVIGAGDAGGNLAAKLCQLKHDVVVIDKKPEALKRLASRLDVLTIEGNGASPRVLAKADVGKADLLVAVTDRDEVNALACVMAHQAGVAHTAARVSDMEYIRCPDAFNLQSLGVDLVVNQDDECARSLLNILRMPGAIEAIELLEGRVMAIGIKAHMDSPLIRTPLNAFPRPELLESIRFLAVKRGDKAIVPRGDTVFKVGDDVFLVGLPEAVEDFIKWAWPEYEPFEKIIIAGGGDLGLHLAELLEKTPLRAILIEKDGKRAEYCTGILSKTTVLQGDAADINTLKNAGVEEDTAFVAISGDDEDNIISCLVAEKLGAEFTLARITKPDYVPIINNLSLLDRVVSPSVAMINAILHFIRGRDVKSASLFHDLPGELLETVLKPGSTWDGRTVRETGTVKGALIATVLRDGQALLPTGDLRLAAGDRLIMFALPEAVNKLEKFFKKT